MSQQVLTNDSFQIKYSSYRSGKHRVNIQPISADLTACLYYATFAFSFTQYSENTCHFLTGSNLILLGEALDSGSATASVCRKGPDSFPGQSIWDLWQTKWHCDMFSFRVLRFYRVGIIPLAFHTH